MVEQLRREGSLSPSLAGRAVSPSLVAPAGTADDGAVVKELQQRYKPWNTELQKVLGVEDAAAFGDWGY